MGSTQAPRPLCVLICINPAELEDALSLSHQPSSAFVISRPPLLHKSLSRSGSFDEDVPLRTECCKASPSAHCPAVAPCINSIYSQLSLMRAERGAERWIMATSLGATPLLCSFIMTAVFSPVHTPYGASGS